LEVLSYERDRSRIPVDQNDQDALRAAVLAKGTERGPSYEALVEAHGAPAAYLRCGYVLLRGRGPGARGCYLSVSFDNRTPARPSGSSWLWSNSICGSVSAARVDGVPRQEWVFRLVEQLAVHTPMLWGAAYLRPEFADSNLDTSHGATAIGRDMRTHLPGIYWLNVFGRPYLDLIGEQQLLAAPAAAARHVGDHVLVQAYPDARAWADNHAVRRSVMAALGAEYFFDRHNPTAAYRAPDFGLPPLPERRPSRS
jgi:hypothetical protein